MTCTKLFLFLTIVTGLLYPLLITGLGNIAFPDKARGEPIVRGGVVVGSALIGQHFSQNRYFWGRPSATEYRSAGATNLGPYHPALASLRASRSTPQATAVPADWATASGSGLDPDISPSSAALQIERVAGARGVEPSKIRDLVARHTQRPDLGFLGEPRVNVLLLNLALDKEYPSP